MFNRQILFDGLFEDCTAYGPNKVQSTSQLKSTNRTYVDESESNRTLVKLSY